MPKPKGENFQNEPSRRMYYFLNELVGQTDITVQKVFEVFGKYQNNPRNYFNALYNGTISVKIDEILKAQKHLRLDPCILFEKTENAFNRSFLAKHEMITGINAEGSSNYHMNNYIDLLKDTIKQKDADILELKQRLNVGSEKKRHASG